MRIRYAALLLCTLGSPSWARYQAALVKEYSGRHQDDFVLQYDRVRLLVHQAQLEVSSGLGLLQYQEGFQYPMVIRFEDGAPMGIENILAYVRLSQDEHGFFQELVVNMDTTSEQKVDFDKVFYHEMTHAVLNDAVGGEASLKIPHWVQEGLAQYISEEGKDRVARAAQHYRRSQVQALLYPLDGPYSGRAYPQYYLAMDYLHERHTVNAVQALVRNLIMGKSVIDSVEDSTGLSWVKFQDNVRDYSLTILQDKARPDF